ncbi:MAG: MarC family protein [Candidatus Bathyarchaeota archaeon]
MFPQDMLVELAKAVITLFIIVDPLGNIPIFMGLTENLSREERRKVFRVATIVASALLIVFAIIGRELLSIFGISTHSFMVAGGVLLLVIAVKLVIYGGWEEKTLSPESLGAVPIACPLLTGPGAITTTIVIIQTSGIIITLFAVIVISIINWVILRFVEPINRFLGKTGSAVVARVMAIFIAAIAIGYIVNGITHFVELS